MKKILALLLALSMAVVAVSCGNKEEEKSEDNVNNVNTEESAETKDETKEEVKEEVKEEIKEEIKEEVKEENKEEVKTEDKKEEPKPEVKPEVNYNTEEDKAAAKTAVDGFMTAYCAYDVAKMSEFTNTDLSAKLGIGNYADFISNKIRSYFTEQETSEMYAEEIAQLETVCKQAILGSASYEVTGAEYSDKNWNFTVSAKNITVSDIFSILHGDKAQELTQQLLDELIAKLENPEITEEEMMEVTQGMLKASLTAIVNLVNESCENAEPKATEYTLTAVKSGDKWIVDYNGAGAQALGNSLLDKADVK